MNEGYPEDGRLSDHEEYSHTLGAARLITLSSVEHLELIEGEFQAMVEAAGQRRESSVPPRPPIRKRQHNDDNPQWRDRPYRQTTSPRIKPSK